MVTIVWDRDDVLNDLMRCWLDHWWKPTHPDCPVGYEDLTENPPYRLLGIGLEDYLASLDEFRLSNLAAEMQPNSEVLAWFKEFGHRCRHMVLSSTSRDSAPSAAAWTFRYFGDWITSFHLLPSKRKSSRDSVAFTDKGGYLAWLGVRDIIFIDDCLTNVGSARKHDIHALVFPRPWNGKSKSVGQVLESLTKLLH